MVVRVFRIGAEGPGGPGDRDIAEPIHGCRDIALLNSVSEGRGTYMFGREPFALRGRVLCISATPYPPEWCSVQKACVLPV